MPDLNAHGEESAAHHSAKKDGLGASRANSGEELGIAVLELEIARARTPREVGEESPGADLLFRTQTRIYPSSKPPWSGVEGAACF